MKFVVIGGGCYGRYHAGQLYKAIEKGKFPPGSTLIMVDRNAEPPAKAEFADKPGFSFVQSDWQEFLQRFMADPQQYDPARDGESVHIVPPPYAPHLFFDWLRLSTETRLHELGYRTFQVAREGFEYKMHFPYEYVDPKNGNHFMSRAGWTCPATCIEPRVCPAIKGERDWDLDRDLRDFVAGQPVRPSVSATSALIAANYANGQDSRATVLDLPPPGHYSAVETFTCHHFAYGIGTVPALRLYEARERTVQLALGLNTSQPEARVAVGTVSHCHGVVATIALRRGN